MYAGARRYVGYPNLPSVTSLMLQADVDASRPPKMDGVTVIGEFRAELLQEPRLKCEVAETGEIKDMHSGGLVVLRCTDGRTTEERVCPGGLQVLDKVLLWGGFFTLYAGSTL